MYDDLEEYRRFGVTIIRLTSDYWYGTQPLPRALCRLGYKRVVTNDVYYIAMVLVVEGVCGPIFLANNVEKGQ